MKLNTSRFGEIDVEEDRIINFAYGLLGFPDVKRYIVLDHPHNPDIPLKWLQAIDDPDLAFVITDPLIFCPDYKPEINKQELMGLNITDAEDCGIISIVTIPHGEPEKMTANLQGPVLINLKTREGKQIVLESDKYPLHYSLIKDIPVTKS